MLKIHFLNVGHGDCTLIEFPSGRNTLVDINNSKVIDDMTKNEMKSLSTYYNLYRELGYEGMNSYRKALLILFHL